MKCDSLMADQPPASPNTISGQAQLLRDHEYWIVGFGMTQRSGMIHSKLLGCNLTSGDYAHMLLPTQKVMTTTEHGEVAITEKLFPGYFLLGVRNDSPAWIEMQIEVEEIFRVLSHSGNNKVGQSVAFLTPDERIHIASLMKDIPYDSILDNFSVGDRVIVKEGSFKGLDGKIMEIRRNKKKAKVHIQIRNTIFPTWFSLFHLEINPNANGNDDIESCPEEEKLSTAASKESKTTTLLPPKS